MRRWCGGDRSLRARGCWLQASAHCEAAVLQAKFGAGLHYTARFSDVRNTVFIEVRSVFIKLN